MTTKPTFRIGRHLIPGLAAVALFVILAITFLNAEFAESAAGFGSGDVSITASIGYALFNIAADGAIESEGFLAAFEIIDVVLIAALAGAVMLARREVGGVVTDALATDGGEQTGGLRTSRDERSESLGSERSEVSRTVNEDAVEHSSTSPASQAREDTVGTSSDEPSLADTREDEKGGDS